MRVRVRGVVRVWVGESEKKSGSAGIFAGLLMCWQCQQIAPADGRASIGQ